MTVFSKKREGVEVEILHSAEHLIIRVYIKNKCYSISNILEKGEILVSTFCDDKEVENIIACALVENPKLTCRGPDTISYLMAKMDDQVANIIMDLILEDIIFADIRV